MFLFAVYVVGRYFPTTERGFINLSWPTKHVFAGVWFVRGGHCTQPHKSRRRTPKSILNHRSWTKTRHTAHEFSSRPNARTRSIVLSASCRLCVSWGLETRLFHSLGLTFWETESESLIFGAPQLVVWNGSGAWTSTSKPGSKPPTTRGWVWDQSPGCGLQFFPQRLRVGGASLGGRRRDAGTSKSEKKDKWPRCVLFESRPTPSWTSKSCNFNGKSSDPCFRLV